MFHGFKQSLALSAAALAAFGLMSAPALAQGKKDKKAEAAAAAAAKPSKGAHKFLVEIQELEKKQDWSGMKTKIAAVEALPDLNNYDRFFLAGRKYAIGQGAKDDVLLQAGLEGMAASEFTPPENKPLIIRSLLSLADKNKDTAKARALGEQYLAMKPDDANVIDYLARGYMRDKNFPAAEAKAVQLVKLSEDKGQIAEEDAYTLLASLRQQGKLPGMADAFRKLAVNYPTGRNWAYLLEDFQLRSQLNGRNGLDLFRLMSQSGALITGGSVIEAAQVAIDSGVPAEVKGIIDRARAAGTLGERGKDADGLIKMAAASVAADESPAKQEAAANTPDRQAAVGQLYLSLGNYPKAISVYQAALAKGVRNKADAQIRLGIAKFLSGDIPGAKESWGQVSGDAKMTELAQLWTLFSGVKK
jgi:tetratricopeptide (TPR) repeat protein